MSSPVEAVWRAVEGVGANSVIRRGRRGRLLVVCYHGICEDDCPERHWLLVRRRTFVRHLDYLRARFRVLPLDEAIAQLRAGLVTEPTAAITFDDGYRNNYTVAWPELRARQLPCTIFLTTGLISTSDTIWPTTLEYAVRGSVAGVLDMTAWSGPRLDLTSPASRTAAGTIAKEWLKDQPSTRRRDIMRRLLAALAPVSPPPAEFLMMGWDDVRALARTGLVRFGAHTVHHEVVSRLDDAGVEREITASVRAVAELGAGASRVFAFPNGRARDFDARAQRMLQSVGANAAVTTLRGTNSAATPPFELRRLVIDESVSRARFGAEAVGVASVLHDAWNARHTGSLGGSTGS